MGVRLPLESLHKRRALVPPLTVAVPFVLRTSPHFMGSYPLDKGGNTGAVSEAD